MSVAVKRAVRVVPAAEGMDEAAARLRLGQLVAFPTETVYGLGANALQSDAVARIFAAKGRPASNPLIVHIADTNGVFPLVREWPAEAEALARRFWPGPLTLVVPKSVAVPEIVTAGGETVGLRLPSHPVALELLRRTGLPIAAPSANRSEEVSPTTAQHVADSLGPFVEDLLVLDGGPCQVGVESTVVDVSQSPPRILRPGMILAAQIRDVLGDLAEGPLFRGEVARSPGQRARHYAPHTPVVIVPASAVPGTLRSGDGLLSRGNSGTALPVLFISMPDSAEGYAQRLFDALRRLDAAGVKRIVIEEPPYTPEWDAIHDRLRR
ncbi:MAG: L-threonylcarbamoyladenylate synthase, partial [Armatimonadota bacterium]